MKNCFLVILGAILLIIAVGCRHYSGKFSSIPVSLQRPEYSVPVKFYVRSIRNKQGYDIGAEELRDAFAKYYPEIFTDDPKRGLAIEFGMDFDPNATLSTLSTSSFLIFLNFYLFLVCPLPIIEEQIYPVTIRSSVIDSTVENGIFSVSGKNTIKERYVYNMLLGFILQTHRLIPEIEDAVFHSSFVDIYYFPEGLVLNKGREKEFLSVFVEQLYRIPPEKVRELYLAKMTSGIKMKK